MAAKESNMNTILFIDVYPKRFLITTDVSNTNVTFGMEIMKLGSSMKRALLHNSAS